MSKGPVLVRSPNLSYAWAKVLSLTMLPGGGDLPELVVRFGPAPEDRRIRDILDGHLTRATKRKADGRQRCQTVAQTIFPIAMLREGQARADLFARYLRILPQLKRCPLNRRGTYFERLISFPNGTGASAPVNQLEKVITDLSGERSRLTALQVGIFNPATDHSAEPYQGFPCLQQVAFRPSGKDKLCLTAFYPLHYLFERAYGNYLGLAALGAFVAAESNREVESITCVAGVGRREIGKSEAEPLHSEVNKYIRSLGGFEALDTVEASLG
jgi:hypothetical protein